MLGSLRDKSLYIRVTHFHHKWNDGCRTQRICLGISLVQFLYLAHRLRPRPAHTHTLLLKILLLRGVLNRLLPGTQEVLPHDCLFQRAIHSDYMPSKTQLSLHLDGI
jgi:hypothetical protein